MSDFDSSQASSAARRLPPLAGLTSMPAAIRPGIPVEECVRRLKREHYAFKRLFEIFTRRLTAEPVYELKMAFSYHAYLCAEHVSAWRTRVGEMREPPLGLEAVPDPALEIFFDEIQAAPTTQALVWGLYGAAVPALQAALEQHRADIHPLADAPTARILRFALLELGDLAGYGAQALAALLDEPARQELAGWTGRLDELLAAAGGLDGARPPAGSPGGPLPARLYSAVPYTYDRLPQRDERFRDPYNMGVNAEAFLYDPSYPAAAKVLMLYYKRLREIDVPEMMASILAETPGKPWEYYRDMARQLWDEARHAMMGEIGFASLDLPWPELTAINFNWSVALNTQLTADERHAVLYFIEQGLMPRTGKRYEWEVADEAGSELSKTFQDYDWADEVLHARIGQTWYVSTQASRAEALHAGDEAWSRVFMNWQQWVDEGLTQHENWWPALYRAACEKWGVEPDPHTLAFNVSYAGQRADLKDVSGPA